MSYTMTNRELKWELLMDGYLDDKISDFMSDDADKLMFGDSYYKKKKRILAHEAFKIAFRKIKYISSKIAMIFVAIILATFVTVMSVSALRNAVWNAIVEWYEEYIDIKYDSTDDTKKELSEIEQIHKPTILPEGMQETVLLEDKTSIIIEYCFNTTDVIIFEQCILNEANNTKVDSIGADVYTMYIGDFYITVIETKGYYKPAAKATTTEIETVKNELQA